MDQLFAQSFVYPNWSGQNMENVLAPMNVCETDQGYQVEVALPGVKPQDIDVNVHQNTLSIKGTFKQEQHQHGQQGQNQSNQNQSGQGQNQSGQHNWLLQELRAGSFERTITFAKPIDADKITTHYEHGILTINVPVSESSKPRKISIHSAQGSQSGQTVQAHQQ
jgi:HSP20 family protein